MLRLVNASLARLDGSFDGLYAKTGRPSIAPERLLRAVLLQMLYSIRSERQLMERLEFDLLFRWFVDIACGQLKSGRCPSKNRTQALDCGNAAPISAAC
jgi:transposase